MDIEKIKQDIIGNLNNLKNVLPDTGFEDINEYMEVGEYKLAMEVLCNMIFEYNILISKKNYMNIMGLCKNLCIDGKYWEPLKNNIKNT